MLLLALSVPPTLLTIVDAAGNLCSLSPSYMRLMPGAVQARYNFECFGKGGADHHLLDLTVTGAKPVADLHRHVKDVRRVLSCTEIM